MNNNNNNNINDEMKLHAMMVYIKTTEVLDKGDHLMLQLSEDYAIDGLLNFDNNDIDNCIVSLDD